ncbi:apyrase-like [Sabethes cyaneus]|uniref:apyrase-like n=1 Tax=Sabethes cyaneus TaxID=53552 RepID=UPI00237E401B|nr:apyrase-like [Sabethes cyaneus]
MKSRTGDVWLKPQAIHQMNCRAEAKGSFRDRLLLVHFVKGTTTIVTFALVGIAHGQEYKLSIIHVNDFHARFEEVNNASVTCDPSSDEICLGGYARMVTVVKDLLAKRTNPLYLNAGDNFQGTLWYNLYGWNVTVEFLNMLPADAMTLGNHEFDHKLEGVLPFMDKILSPLLLVNVDNSEEPSFSKYEKSMIIERNGRKIGIIGVILRNMEEYTAAGSTGNLVFEDEVETVRLEAENLTNQGVNIIIVLSHCGIETDIEIAAHGGPNIDIIVGGHSHTFLYTGEHPHIPGTSRGTYPVVVDQPGGNHKVLIVQAAAYTKLVGDIVLSFDERGIIQSWEGNPVYLSTDVVPDPEILEALIPWKEAIDVVGGQRVGFSSVDLLKSSCGYGECNLGSLIADSMVEAFMPLAEPGHWTYASIAVIAIGGIRVSMLKGVLNFGMLIEVIPFENLLTVVELRGDRLLGVLEYAVEKSQDDDWLSFSNMVQISGLHVEYNVTNPIGQQVLSVEVLCSECMVPKYEPLKALKYYRVVTNSFVAGGGDGFTIFSEFGVNKRNGPIDIEAFEKYVTERSPIMQGVDGRIKVYT